MPTYTSPGTFVDGSTTVPVSSANLQPMVAALVQALQADGSGPVLAALLKIAQGTGFQGNADTLDILGVGLDGSSDVGVGSANHAAVSYSGSAVWSKFNNKFNGTNDVFLKTGFTAYQMNVGASGVQCRKSTNTATAGATITWGSYTVLFS